MMQAGWCQKSCGRCPSYAKADSSLSSDDVDLTDDDDDDDDGEAASVDSDDYVAEAASSMSSDHNYDGDTEAGSSSASIDETEHFSDNYLSDSVPYFKSGRSNREELAERQIHKIRKIIDLIDDESRRS